MFKRKVFGFWVEVWLSWMVFLLGSDLVSCSNGLLFFFLGSDLVWTGLGFF